MLRFTVGLLICHQFIDEIVDARKISPVHCFNYYRFPFHSFPEHGSAVDFSTSCKALLLRKSLFFFLITHKHRHFT